MRKLVTIEQILEKKAIQGADRIEAVRIREWWVVCKKDEFQINDFCLFYEIDSFLPIKPEYEFLLKGSKPKKLLVDGKEIEGIRLKSIKLKGQLSQGLALPISSFQEFKNQNILNLGTDVTELLGVIKYDPPLPAELSGKAKGFFPSFLPKTDEERIQNMPEVLSNFFISEKIDGTSVSFFKKDGVFGVCSRNLELAEGDTTQWRLAKKYDLQNKLSDNFAIQGEIIGEGIQKNPLKQKGQDVYFFNAYNISTRIYLDYIDFISFCTSLKIKTVPILNDNYTLPKTVDELLIYAEGKSLLNENEEREGIVIRPKIEMKYKGQRFSFKAISNKYLLKEI